ncbi:MAG TPA: VWA domain-containing protein [Bryobacteraceae bacterium]|nr:VWA domain-containing protein [Bryobacteraceae bacterium]
MNKLRLGRTLGLLILIVSSFGQAQEAAENIPLFRSEVSLVKVDVSVAGADGRTIGGLERGDFRVLDEGQPQSIAAFDRETDPLAMILLVDVSGSMRPSLTELVRSTQEALSRLHPGDRVGLMLFASRVQLVEPFTSDFHAIRTRLLTSIYKQTLGQDTFTNEALLAAAREMRALPPATRRAIVMVTDNGGERKALQDAEVIRALQDANAVLSAIIVGKAQGPSGPSRYADPTSGAPDVRKYVRGTGGDFADVGDVGDLFKKLIGTIRTRYTFQYAAPAAETGTFRRIRVELSPEAGRRNPGAVIQAREGYYAGVTPAPATAK